MRIDDRYELRVVILEIIDGIGMNRAIGDVYDNLEEFRHDKPDSSYKFGYVVFDTLGGYVPEECNEWNDSPDEALDDYRENCFRENKSAFRRIEPEEFKRRVVKVVKDKDSNIKDSELYFSQTETGYYLEYKPNYPCSSSGDFVVYQDLNGCMSVYGNCYAVIPTISHYESIEDFEKI